MFIIFSSLANLAGFSILVLRIFSRASAPSRHQNWTFLHILAPADICLHTWAQQAAAGFEHRFASVGEIGGLPVLEVAQVIGAILIYVC
jgi:hypothetical protein